VSGGLRFVTPQAPASELKPKREPKREPKQKVKNDPRFVAAARELRDRWLEQVNADPSALSSQGKYDVSKELAAQAPTALVASAPLKQLSEAA
jgi:hypothetical protein